MADWAREKNIPYRVLKDRLRPRSLGWTLEEALTRPVLDGLKKTRATSAENGKGLRRFSAWVGDRVGRLVIESYIPGRKREKIAPIFVCRCDCGTTDYQVSPYNLLYARRDNDKIGCGCVASERIAAANVENATHGMSGIPEYQIWSGMIQRCHNVNAPSFERYGGRGIRVCARWLESFENFIEDMGRRPADDLQIEREDNDGPYCKDNCAWATTIEQMNNTRMNKHLTYQGRTQTIAQWAREFGIRDGKFRYYLRSGRTIDQILNLQGASGAGN